MTAGPMIGDREKLLDAQQHRRDGLVAFAEFLLGKATAEQVVAAFCPGVDPERQKTAFADLLHVVDNRGSDHTDLPHDGQVDLNYMTGEWR